jgi:hypothetical protein
MDRGKRLVYDDDGNPHEVYELEDEAAFKAKGLPEVQRQKFIEKAREVVQTADVEDKAAAKAKKREKIRKRKERERGEGADEDDDEGVELEETGWRTSLQMLNSLTTTRSKSSNQRSRRSGSSQILKVTSRAIRRGGRRRSNSILKSLRRSRIWRRLLLVCWGDMDSIDCI